MILHQPQKVIAKDSHRFRVVCAGRRFGKTILSGEEILGKALFKNNQSIAYIAPTYRQARDIMWEHMKDRFRTIIEDINESRLEITIKTKLGGTSKITLRGWESIESLRGQKFDFLVLDEVAMFRNFWVGWHEVLQPALIDNRGDALFISTPKGYNHFYDLYEMENKDDSYKSFRYTTYDNPHMPADEIERAKKEIAENRFSQEYLADFRKTEGLVYKTFNRVRHTYDSRDAKPDPVDIIEGIDFGWHTMASISIERGRDGVYRIDNEWYKKEKTTRDMIEEHLNYAKPHSIYPDSAEPDRIEELKRAGFKCVDVKKGKDSIKAGVEAIQSLIQQNRFLINKDCLKVLEEIESYHYPDKQDNKNEDEIPVKENDHAMDAIRYALFTHAGLSAQKTNRSTRESKDFREMMSRRKLKGNPRQPLFIR